MKDQIERDKKFLKMFFNSEKKNHKNTFSQKIIPKNLHIHDNYSNLYKFL